MSVQQRAQPTDCGQRAERLGSGAEPACQQKILNVGNAFLFLCCAGRRADDLGPRRLVVTCGQPIELGRKNKIDNCNYRHHTLNVQDPSIPARATHSLACHARLEGREPGDRPPQDERMHVMRALVRVDRLEVDQMAHYVELIRDAVAAEHVAALARDVEGLAARVALDERDHLGGELAAVLCAADGEGGVEPEGELGDTVGELELRVGHALHWVRERKKGQGDKKGKGQLYHVTRRGGEYIQMDYAKRWPWVRWDD